jgi:phage terminase large subunit
MKRHGFPLIVPAEKGPNSVEDGIEFLKTYDIVVHPRCRHTSDELSQYAFKVDKKTDEVLPVLEDKNNHVIDALRYAVEGVRLGRPRLIVSKEALANAARGGRRR